MFRQKNQHTEPAQRPRQVIINATNIGSRPGGIAVYTLCLLREFARQERELQFVVYLNKNCHPDIHEIDFPPNFTLKWVTRYLSPDYRFAGHLLRLLFANLLSLRHPRNLLVNTSQLEACFFRRRQIITIHDVIPLLFRQFHRKQYHYFRYLLRHALRPARWVVTPSRHTRWLLNEVLEIHPERIRVIHNGIRRPRGSKSPTTMPPQPYLLFVGRLCPMKNVGALLAAFALLRERIPHQLVIVGDDENYLDDMLKAQGLTRAALGDQRVVFRPYLPEGEMFQLMQQADMFVYPSLYEGFGMPPLEAMAAGCPVICARAASLPEVCGDAAVYIDPQNPADIANAILALWENAPLRQQLISRGKARAALFRWKTAAAAHLALIRTALHLTPPHAAPASAAAPATSAIRKTAAPGR